MEQVPAVTELNSGNHLREHICWVILGMDLHHIDVTFIKNISDKVISHVNVLRARMVDLILRKANDTHTVASDFHEVLINYQVIQKPLKLQSFFHCFSHGHVLGLRSRQRHC